jgi:hypothetical protein
MYKIGREIIGKKCGIHSKKWGNMKGYKSTKRMCESREIKFGCGKVSFSKGPKAYGFKTKIYTLSDVVQTSSTKEENVGKF